MIKTAGQESTHFAPGETSARFGLGLFDEGILGHGHLLRPTSAAKKGLEMFLVFLPAPESRRFASRDPFPLLIHRSSFFALLLVPLQLRCGRLDDQFRAAGRVGREVLHLLAI